jgi:hypothetical protein
MTLNEWQAVLAALAVWACVVALYWRPSHAVVVVSLFVAAWWFVLIARVMP